MTRTLRIAILTGANWSFWFIAYGLTWHHQIPERLTAPTFLLSQLFAWPLGLFCFSLWFLINAQLHTAGWRLVLTAAILLANGVLWAWLLDWLWHSVTRRSPRGFPVRQKGDERESL
jgi:hypothetical protein